MRTIKVIIIYIITFISILNIYSKQIEIINVKLEYYNFKIVADNTVEKMGIIDIYDFKNNKIYSKKLYKVFINPFLERDVQWIFIKKLYVFDEKLFIENEKCKKYKIDINKIINDYLEKMDQIDFDENLWKNGNIKFRGKMVRKLIDNKYLLNKSKDEIIALLGKPDYENKNEYLYKVDIGVIFVSDVWWYDFVIEFNENKIVNGYELRD